MTRGNFPAHGFSWNKEDKRCLGIKNANVINTKDTKWESCIFTGNFNFQNKLHNQKGRFNYLYNIFWIKQIFHKILQNLAMKDININEEYQMEIHSTQQNLQMTRYAQFIAMEIIVVLRTNIMIKLANYLTRAK